MQLEHEELVRIIEKEIENLSIKEETLELQRYEYLQNFFRRIRNNNEEKVTAQELLFLELLRIETEVDFEIVKKQIEELKPIIEDLDIHKLYYLESIISNLTKEQIESWIMIASNMPKFTIKLVMKILNMKGIDKLGINLKSIDDFNVFVKLLLLIKKVIRPSQVKWLPILIGDSDRNLYSCCDIYRYFEELQTSIKTKEKEKKMKLCKYQKLLEILAIVSEREEIVDINSMLFLIEDEEIKNSFLWYVNTHNQKYYQQLEKEYHDKNENSISKYIGYFQSLGYSFLELPTQTREHFLEMGLDAIKKKMNLLIKLLIDKNEIIKLCDKSSLEGILETEEILRNNYIDLTLLSQNVALYYDLDIRKNYLENIKTLLKQKINLSFLEDKSFMLKDAKQVRKNLDFLNTLSIPITQMKDFTMLAEEDLVERVASFIEVGLETEIKENPEILNSDSNLAKRIMIAKLVGENPFNEEGIKEEIRNKESFFVPDEKINDYLLDRNHSNYLCQANIIFPEDDRLKETSYSYIVEGIVIPKLRVTGLCSSLENIIAPSLYSAEEVKKLEKYRKMLTHKQSGKGAF